MDNIKRFRINEIPGHIAIVTDPNGILCLYGEVEVERLAHEKTKQELVDARKEIEELRVIANDLQFAYWNKDEEFPHGFETVAIDNYKKYLERGK